MYPSPGQFYFSAGFLSASNRLTAINYCMVLIDARNGLVLSSNFLYLYCMPQQLKLLNSEEDFKLFVQETGDYIASQAYQSIYVSKLNQKQFIIKALIKQYLVYR